MEPGFQCRIEKSYQIIHFLSRINQIPRTDTYICKINSEIVLPRRLFPVNLPVKILAQEPRRALAPSMTLLLLSLSWDILSQLLIQNLFTIVPQHTIQWSRSCSPSMSCPLRKIDKNRFDLILFVLYASSIQSLDNIMWVSNLLWLLCDWSWGRGFDSRHFHKF